MKGFRDIFRGPRGAFNIGIALLFCVLLILVISGWMKSDRPEEPGEHQKKIERGYDLFSIIRSLFLDDEEKNSPSRSSDPRLKDVDVVEMETVQPGDEPKTSEEKRIQGLLLVLTEPMSVINKKFPSFTYEGTMRVTVPTRNDDLESFKKGKKYGKGIEVVSSFIYRKDEAGNFHLRQRTQVEKKDSDYNGDIYNGNLYYVDRQYVFTDLKGVKRDDSVLKSVLLIRQQDNSEPLVRRNWIQIVKDLDMVMTFDLIEEEGDNREYSIRGANPDKQQKTIYIRHLFGGFMLLETNSTMLSGKINGDVRNMRGYMIGSDMTFAISMRIYDIGKVPPIAAP